jgi:hypothetical protein
MTAAAVVFAVLSGCLYGAVAQITVNHNCTRFRQIPAKWVEEAKKVLHIAYGHTSHGSQLTDGMTGLVTFTKGGGGPQFAWNNGGTSGALDLHDYAMPGDLGNYPKWIEYTKTYLNDPKNKDVNVVVWAWCGQVLNYTSQMMIDRYLAPMSQLEKDYPNVTFVYMTDHLNFWYRPATTARNDQIRDYCIANKKILYDFADIESYDPDGIYYRFAQDSCDYYQYEWGRLLGNWAKDWQSSHKKDVEWYECTAAHSQPLNGNLKAFAAWWLWARLAGWPGMTALTGSARLLSAKTGGTVRLDLDAGTTRAAKTYVLTGSLSGTSPGLPLPGGQVTLPLNPDIFTYVIIGLANTPNFKDFVGVLDNQGKATASLTLGVMPTEIAGFSLHLAYTTAEMPFTFVSNPVSVKFVP